MFFLLYKRTDDGALDDFSKIADHFAKICENFTKLFRRPGGRCRTFIENFRKSPKMSEDFRRLPKTFEGDPKMFRWYTNEFKYNLRDKLDVSEIIDIFTCEDTLSFLSICYHSVYQWLLYNKNNIRTLTVLRMRLVQISFVLERIVPQGEQCKGLRETDI